MSQNQESAIIGTNQELQGVMEGQAGAPIEIVVAETESFPDFDFDPAEMLSKILVAAEVPPRYVVAIRTPGASSPRSQNAFSAEFSELCDARTAVLVEDAVGHRKGRVVGKKQGSTAKTNGIVQVRQWADIIDYVQDLLEGGPIRPFVPLHSEAVALVSAMYGGHATQKALGQRHQAILLGLSKFDTTVLPEKLGYARKTISNAYGEIARILSKDRQSKPQAYCCELAEQYRGWLQSLESRRAETFD